MVENKASVLFVCQRMGNLIILILCLNFSGVITDSMADSLSYRHLNHSQEVKLDEDVDVLPVIDDDHGTEQMFNTTNGNNIQSLFVDNTSMLVTPINNTEHQGFLHGFVESLSVILVSELGDKTFFIAAILAMQNNKLTVFLAAIFALAAMTVLSALLGFVVTKFIPRIYTYYACTGIMFLFGIKMLWEAWRMSDTEVEDTQREVEEEIARRGSISSSNRDVTEDPEASQPMQCLQEIKESELNNEKKLPAASAAANPPKTRLSFRHKIRENSWFGKKCCKIFKIFTNTFGMTFLAEWGDRSQLATIVLAGINDVTGVCVGGILGHFICTGLAVLCGALIAKKISVRKVTVLGALVFIGFAVASLFIDPYEENHLVPDVEGDDHNATVYQVNDISFVESSTSNPLSTLS